MRLKILILALLSGVACSGASLPQPVVDEIGSSLSGIGHPGAEFVSASHVGGELGTLANKTKDRYIDIAIRYRRAKPEDSGEHTMALRLYIKSLEPCRIASDVISDDGPKAALLDNAVVSRLVGAKICGAIPG